MCGHSHECTHIRYVGEISGRPIGGWTEYAVVNPQCAQSNEDSDNYPVCQYRVENLQPDKAYELELSAQNSVGFAQAQRIIFRTSSVNGASGRMLNMPSYLRQTPRNTAKAPCNSRVYFFLMCSLCFYAAIWPSQLLQEDEGCNGLTGRKLPGSVVNNHFCNRIHMSCIPTSLSCEKMLLHAFWASNLRWRPSMWNDMHGILTWTMYLPFIRPIMHLFLTYNIRILLCGVQIVTRPFLIANFENDEHFGERSAFNPYIIWLQSCIAFQWCSLFWNCVAWIVMETVQLEAAQVEDLRKFFEWFSDNRT